MSAPRTIADLLARDLTKGKIEEIVKVDQVDEHSVFTELTEYIATDRLREHYRHLFKAMAEYRAQPHEGTGVWISGFFGSGKSSFAKNLGYVVGNRTVLGHRASDLFKKQLDDQICESLIDLVNLNVPTDVVMFDVQTDRASGGSGSVSISHYMYRSLLRAFDYAEDFDIAELEQSLEADGRLDEFIRRFEARYGDWRKRRKMAQKMNEASAILHEIDRGTYPHADSWARGLAGKQVEATPALLVERTFELAARRRPGNERAHGHTRNLVVAATGTGKTVVAALDYARLRKELGGDPSLLFIAHREEILQQSLAKYRAALGNGYFGELLVGTRKPRRGRHVFASIQALHSERRASLRPDAYDVIVVDEFHHAAAESYTAVLKHFKPKILLGLTATPERGDGKSVLSWFDGRIAAELRLWDALDQSLVVPFQYFGIHDGTKLSTIAFNRGRYDVASLESLYTADHVRANAVLRAIHATVRAPHQMRALGFCVSVKHAEFMASFFNSKGLPSLSVDHESSDTERATALQELRSGKVKVLFVRDLFNEGLDLPGIDTVLFLRPTESATIFLQQLGRGLRHEEGKSCLTVLDFIGDAHRSFRFIDRFRALTRGTRSEVHRAIADGFPRLPAGCDIRLDRESQNAVLANIRQSLSNNWSQLADDLRHAGDIPLASFLAAVDLEPEELYSNDSRTFTELRHHAGFRKEPLPKNELTRAISRLTYVDDGVRLQQWAEWLAQNRPPAPDLSNPLMLMLFSVLGFVKRPVTEMSQAFNELWSAPDLRNEIVELLRLLDDRSRRPTFAFADLPFRLHASYSRDEISAGLLQTRRKKEKGTDRLGPAKLLRTQSGVFQCEDARADILYVELDKDPKHYTPTTLYDDRAVTPSLFHWESQSRTRADSGTGRRYRANADSEWRILLFVRHKPDDDRGFTSPYLFLGRVRYVSHESEKPMRIMWKLDVEMPLDFFSEVKIAAG